MDQVRFREDGFLSIDSDKVIRSLRENEPEWFAYATRLNKAAHQLYLSTDPLITGRTTHDPICVASRLMIRCLSGFQGAIILAERGMTIEAHCLTRSGYENGFWLGYLNKQPKEAVEALVADEMHSELARHRLLLERTVAAGRDAVELPPLEARIAELILELKGKERRIPIPEIAKRADLEAQYLFHKQLSATAAHPSFHSLSHHISMNDDGTWAGHVWGPDGPGIGRAVNLASHALLLSLSAFSSLMGSTPYDEAVADLADEYRTLTYREKAA
jgi:hypothetical protein